MRQTRKTETLVAEAQFIAPKTTADAVRALAASKGTAKILAGGTDLLVQTKSGRIRPDLFVDVKRIPDMIGIRIENGAFVIGAATSEIGRAHV